ncbi:transposase [Cetobacterium sp.]|uniref:transposase n=1 Tax=Cetobacterium sp. TaxID=2071632 RepID=UPI003F3EB45D
MGIISNKYKTGFYVNSDKKIYLTLSIDQFIGRLLLHIPPKDFKMIRRFGLYSRRHKKKKPKKIKLFKDKISWAEHIFKTFKMNPLICPKCNSDLVLLEIFHIKYGVIFPKASSS